MRKRGRKPNEVCPKCGVALNAENTHPRKGGGRTSTCKVCDSRLCGIRRLRKMSLEDVLKNIEKHKYEIKMLRRYGGKK